MFRIETTDPDRLKRIAAIGTGGLVLGMILVVFNLVLPVMGEGGLNAENVVFGLFGLLAVVLATHPTYQAALQLDED